MKLPIRYLNASDDRAAKVKDCNDRGLTVVNAPRPMSGEEYWEDRFLCGVFFVAGDRARWQKHWLAYDGREVVLVSNLEVLQAVIEKAKGHRYASSLEGIIRSKGAVAIKEMAAPLNMPYFPEAGTFEADLASADFSGLEAIAQ